MFNGVAMCCGDVMLPCMGTVLNIETTVSMFNGGHVLWRCPQHMGTVLDFELLSQCSMVWPCVVEMWCSCYGYGVEH